MNKTRYKGIDYDNRTQARWAVFFDSIGIDFEYNNSTINHPTFYLKKLNAYAQVQEYNESYHNFCFDFAVFLNKGSKTFINSNITVIVLDGVPEAKPYSVYGGGDNIVFCPIRISEEDRLFYSCSEDDGSDCNGIDDLREIVHNARAIRFENF